MLHSPPPISALAFSASVLSRGGSHFCPQKRWLRRSLPRQGPGQLRRSHPWAPAEERGRRRRRRREDAEPPAGAAQGGGDAAAGQGGAARPAQPPQGGRAGPPVYDQRQRRERDSIFSSPVG